MTNFWKAIGTVTIWIAIGAIIISGMYATNTRLDINAIAIVSLIIGSVATGIIWVGVQDEGNVAQSSHIEREKAKRDRLSNNDDTKLQLLLEMMDEDERYAFKETLKRRVLDSARITDDGELTYGDASLSDLLEEDAYERSYRA